MLNRVWLPYLNQLTFGLWTPGYIHMKIASSTAKILQINLNAGYLFNYPSGRGRIFDSLRKNSDMSSTSAQAFNFRYQQSWTRNRPWIHQVHYFIGVRDKWYAGQQLMVREGGEVKDDCSGFAQIRQWVKSLNLNTSIPSKYYHGSAAYSFWHWT